MSVVGHHTPIGSSSSMATQKALVKVKRAKPKQKDMRVGIRLSGKRGVQGREGHKARWG